MWNEKLGRKSQEHWKLAGLFISIFASLALVFLVLLVVYILISVSAIWPAVKQVAQSQVQQQTLTSHVEL